MEGCDEIIGGRCVDTSYSDNHHKLKVLQLMDGDRKALDMAQEGLQLIEAAILRLLEKNPQGLRNAQIATRSTCVQISAETRRTI